MRTYTEYEPKDIDPRDPVHKFLTIQLMLTVMTGYRSKDGRPNDQLTAEESQMLLNEPVAAFLNAAQKAGISITVSEVPAPFKGAFDGTI